MLKEEMLWYWFVNIPWVGRKTQKYLLDIYSSPSNLYQATHVEISRYIKNEKVLNSILDSKDEEKILKEAERLEKLEKVLYTISGSPSSISLNAMLLVLIILIFLADFLMSQ